jgi:S-adenosylmethionine-diacylglycerol 3-amino-3-carboxypropyl transferase
MSDEHYVNVMEQLAEVGRPGGRLAYWNMLVPRSRPDTLAERLSPLSELAHELQRKDRACFYSAFILEEILS